MSTLKTVEVRKGPAVEFQVDGRTVEVNRSKFVEVSSPGPVGATGGGGVTITATLTTTDATPQSLELLATIVAGTNYVMEGILHGRNTGATGGTAGDHWAYRVTGALKYVGSTVSMTSSGETLRISEPSGKAVATADRPRILADDTAKAIDVRVTGQAGETIDWEFNGSCYEI